ncbi:hypothetical protein A4X09_0g7358 [Tilletia walkeri]|uniref:Uncharacterized protein n=1 Tax=Tilletia walkeri TaxID=117179 RepID=A0A8X7N3D8_9BASI|nr:hypothetical protein A4X09_0g7358 [Tilletia walkeri]
MVHFCKLVALLSFLLSTTVALPLDGTPPARSSTALHPDGAFPQWTGGIVHFPPPGRLSIQREDSSDWELPPYPSAEAEKARFLTRGDPPIKGFKAFDESETDKIMEAMRKGEQFFVKVTRPVAKDAQAAQSSAPPSRIPWPEHRLNTKPSDPNVDKPSTSGRP